jgi:hypothetical protein
MTTWVTFVPSMLWIFAGAPFVEPLRANRQLSGALAAITAAVVGVILNLSVWFALHVLFGKVTEMHIGPLRWYAFDPFALDLRAAALAAIAALLAFGLHRSLIEVVCGKWRPLEPCCNSYSEASLRGRSRSRANAAKQDARSPRAQRRSRHPRATTITAPQHARNIESIARFGDAVRQTRTRAGGAGSDFGHNGPDQRQATRDAKAGQHLWQGRRQFQIP